MRSSAAAREMARARWGERPRMADKALDTLARVRSELAPDQAERLRELAANDKEK